MDWEAPSHADIEPDPADPATGGRGAIGPVSAASGGSAGLAGLDLTDPEVVGPPSTDADLTDPRLPRVLGSGFEAPGSGLTEDDATNPDITGIRDGDVDLTSYGLAGSGQNGRWDWRSALRSASASPPSAGSEADQPDKRAARKASQTSRRIRREPMIVDGAIVSRPLINPRLRADPRLRIWVTRAILTVVVYLIAMIWLGWRIAASIAVVVLIADIIFRAKTTAIVPAGVRVTAAQHSTQRRLRMLRAAGYLALNTRHVPGTRSVIDHVVVGPAGIFVIDSEKLDKRLTIQTIGGMLYHGPNSQEERLKHAGWEARQAAHLIGSELGRRIRVRPAMFVYGPAVPWVAARMQGVDVVSGSRIGAYFRRQSKATAKRHLTAQEIDLVFAAAARALPPLH